MVTANIKKLVSAYLNGYKEKFEPILIGAVEKFVIDAKPPNKDMIVTFEDAAFILIALNKVPSVTKVVEWMDSPADRKRYFDLLAITGLQDELTFNYEKKLEKLPLPQFKAINSAIPRDENVSWDDRVYADKFLEDGKDFMYRPSHIVAKDGYMFRGLCLQSIEEIRLVDKRPIFCTGDYWQARHYAYGYTLDVDKRAGRKAFVLLIRLKKNMKMWEVLDGEWLLPENSQLVLDKVFVPEREDDVILITADLVADSSSKVFALSSAFKKLIRTFRKK